MTVSAFIKSKVSTKLLETKNKQTLSINKKVDGKDENAEQEGTKYCVDLRDNA